MAKKEAARKQEKALRRTHPETGMNPWEQLDRWFQRATRQGWLRPGFWEWPTQPESMAVWRAGMPKVDVVDRDNEVVVRAEMPGVAKEDLDVTASGDSVTLKAHTSHEEKEEKGEYYRCEMSYGEYQRTVSLPHTVDGEKATATFKDGVLELTLPKLEKTSRKKVKVE
jgi:HSP20 family protein